MKKILLSLLSVVLLIPNSLALAQENSETLFTDVSYYHDYSMSIEYLKENKIVKGYNDGSFKPDDLVTRSEFAKIVTGLVASEDEIEKYSGQQCFPDVSTKDALNSYICYAKANNIIKGFSDNTFKPQKPIAFHEASKIILETFDYDMGEYADDWYKKALKKMSDLKNIPPTVKKFEKKVTRGEMAELIMRAKEKSEDYISEVYDEENNKIEDNIPNISSCADLKEKLSEVKPQYLYRTMDENMMMDAMPMAKSVKNSAQSVGVAGDFSTTNIQVDGVDEGDSVKNDGKYIYMLKNNEVSIINAYPANQMNEVSVIDFEDDFYPTSIYLDGDKLIVLGSAYNTYPYMEENIDFMMPYMNSSKVAVKIYEISNHSNPVLKRTISFDGDINSSRRIGDYLYLVLNTYPQYYALENEDFDVSNIIPKVTDSYSGQESVASCGEIAILPPISSPSFLTIAAIPINNDYGKIDREVILGSSENIYSSVDNIYVVSSHYDYDFYPSTKMMNSIRPSNVQKTLIHKFKLDGGDIEYSGSGKVPGRILNQFSLDEYDNHFRIATTTGNMWSINSADISRNNIYVLDEDLQISGKIEGIAKGEKIYSTRFMGKRGYMVTFKNTDPLFAIDLSNPNNPEILGKLKIPGYSDYMHPYDENHIIGFGKDAVEVKGEDKNSMENFAWYQGMKIALFDVTDMSNPRQMFTEVIGDRGTQSELLYNHKALLFDKSKNLLAFPISVAEVREGEDLGTYGQTVFQGAYIYNINLSTGFTLKDKKSHYDDYTNEYKLSGDYFYGEVGKNIERIIYIGDSLYTISESMIKGYDLNTLQDEGEVSL